jgi:hypothetical protein
MFEDDAVAQNSLTKLLDSTQKERGVKMSKLVVIEFDDEQKLLKCVQSLPRCKGRI